MVIKINRKISNKTNNVQNNLSLKKSLTDNTTLFKEIFSGDNTIIFRDIQTLNSTRCLLIFADGMADTKIINDNILYPIMGFSIEQNSASTHLPDILMSKVIVSDDIEKQTDLDMIVGSILYGDTVLLIDGQDEALIINTKGWKTRTIEEPTSERIVKGPREGFIESLAVNISLVKRKIKNPNLKFILKNIGVETKTSVCICYIEGIASPKILNELKNRLDKINIDGILGSNYIEELIADSPFSPFSTTGYTQRPDTVAGKLLEGRIAIIVDGTPVVITIPYIFLEYFQSTEDYYDNYLFASFNRILRYLAFFLSTSVPAIYVSLVTYHQEMIPTPLLLSIGSARDGVPFPTIVEAFAMIIVFDLLREGGIRLPEPIGTAISIVGALVLGQAAVEAKLVSAPIVIVVALTAISAFLIYTLKGAAIIVRFVFLILSGFLGLYGYIFGVIGLFIHLLSLRSFGVPYMLNLGAINPEDVKDTVIRAPWWYMIYRPKLIAAGNPVRQSNTRSKGRS